MSGDQSFDVASIFERLEPCDHLTDGCLGFAKGAIRGVACRCGPPSAGTVMLCVPCARVYLRRWEDYCRECGCDSLVAWPLM